MSAKLVRQENFTVDYKEHVLPAHFYQQASDCSFDDALPQFDCARLTADVFDLARQTLLIACDQISDESIIDTLREKADNGLRIYLLMGDAKGNSRVIDVLSGRCLIRTGVRQKGIVVLRDHTTTQAQGLLLMDETVMTMSDKWAWTIELEPQQIDKIHRNFCKLFWESSTGEYVEQHKKQEPVAHPDGDVLSIQSDQLTGQIENCVQQSVADASGTSCLAFDVATHAQQVLLNTEKPEVKELARHGVALTDTSVPSLVLSTNGNWLIPDYVQNQFANWCLRLSEQQSDKLNSAYTQAMNTAAWQYRSDEVIGDVPDKQLLRFADHPDQTQSMALKRSEKLVDIYTDDIED